MCVTVPPMTNPAAAPAAPTFAISQPLVFRAGLLRGTEVTVWMIARGYYADGCDQITSRDARGFQRVNRADAFDAR